MCTLTLLRDPASRYPLVIAANRDEHVDRPSAPPHLWAGSPTIVAGRDLRAGGTWLGINAQGLVVGLTNHWTGKAADPNRSSRGELVRSLLRMDSAESCRMLLRQRDPRQTNPCMVLCAEIGGEAFWAASERGLHPQPIGDDIFALGNRLPIDGKAQKIERARELFRAAVSSRVDDSVESWVRALQSPLAHHSGDRGPAESICVHTDRGFGTVSSTILLLEPELGDSVLWHAAGPPCTAAFEDRSEELHGLRATP
jgi:uncharacterized protein with NRDE domain